MDVSLTKLRYLVTLAQMRNFSRAAEALNISQPALSRAIASIEERYDVVLFERSRGGLKVTAAGIQVVAEADALLRNARSLDLNLQRYGSGEAGKVGLGLGPAVAGLMLAELSRRLYIAHRNIQLDTRIKPPEILAECLFRDDIELFCCPGSDTILSLPDLDMEFIGRMTPEFIVRRGHPLDGQEGVTLDDIIDFPIAGPTDVTWAKRGGVSAGGLVCDNNHIIREVISHSDMIWLSYRKFVESELKDRTLRVLEVSNSPLTSQPIVIARINGRTISSAADRVVNIMRGIFVNAGN